jgi:molecular chaperone GrpE
MFNMNKKAKNKVKEDLSQNSEEIQDKDTVGSQEEVSTEEGNIENANQPEEAAEMDAADAVQVERDKYLRLYSEFENFRRRTTKERLEMMQNASKDLMVELLPIVDDMERALKAMQKSGDSAAVEGMELIFKKLYGTLEKKGLKPMNAQGEVFDPEIHEAVTQFDAPTEDMKGKVIDELEKGYFLNDKVIRFAKVVVGK